MIKIDELWSFDGDYTRAQATKDYEKLYDVVQKQFNIGGKNLLLQEPRDECLSRAIPRRYEHRRLGAQLCPGGQGSKLGQLIENAIPNKAANTSEVSGLWPVIRTPNRTPKTPNPSSISTTISPTNTISTAATARFRAFCTISSKTRNRHSDGDCPDRRYQYGEWKVRLSLTRDSRFSRVYDKVILALPFSTLRHLDITNAGFQDAQMPSH